MSTLGHHEPLWEEDPQLFRACPINASLGVFGRKWAVSILRDLAFSRNRRFGQILAVNPGLTDRMLSLRLRELIEEGYIERVTGAAESDVSYRLTQKGEDMVPVLVALVRFGMLHHADKVFVDQRPRELTEVDPAFWRIIEGFPRAHKAVRASSSQRGRS